MTEPTKLDQNILTITNMETTSRSSFDRGFCKQLQDGGHWRFFGHQRSVPKIVVFAETERYGSVDPVDNFSLTNEKQLFGYEVTHNINKAPTNSSVIFNLLLPLHGVPIYSG